MRVRGKFAHVYRESETATIARAINLLPPAYDAEAQSWKVFGRGDTIVRIGTRATMLTYMKGRKDQWWRMTKIGDISDPGLKLVKTPTEWDVREPILDTPVFSGTIYMCKWYMIGRADELQGL
jgi:hypothetical protein